MTRRDLRGIVAYSINKGKVAVAAWRDLLS